MKNIFKNLTETITIIITCSLGIISAVLYPLGIISQSIVLSIVVSLLTLLTTSEIILRKSRLDKIDTSLENNFFKLFDMLNCTSITVFKDEKETYKYLNNRIVNFNGEIKDATLGPGTEKDIIQERKDYYKTRDSLIKNGKIHYRYVTVINTRKKYLRISDELDRLNKYKYYLGYYHWNESSIPIISFTIVDVDEIILGAHKRLNSDAEECNDLLIKNKEIVKLFSNYYELLWQKSEKINAKGVVNNELLLQIKNSIWKLHLTTAST
jgi:hypothetical protein